jgi:hypothetical protein
MNSPYRLAWNLLTVGDRVRGEVAESLRGTYTIERAKNGLFELRLNGERLRLCASFNEAKRTADEAERDTA